MNIVEESIKKSKSFINIQIEMIRHKQQNDGLLERQVR